MFYVRLKQNWPGTFRRTVNRDDKGKSLRQREFAPGEIVKIPPEELPHLVEDFGKALEPVEWSEEFRKYRPVPLDDLDLDGTVEAIRSGKFVADRPDVPVVEPLDGKFVLVDYSNEEPSYYGPSLTWSDDVPKQLFDTHTAASEALQQLIKANMAQRTSARR